MSYIVDIKKWQIQKGLNNIFKGKGSSSREGLFPAVLACGWGHNVGLVFDILSGWTFMARGEKWLQTTVYF